MPENTVLIKDGKKRKFTGFLTETTHLLSEAAPEVAVNDRVRMEALTEGDDDPLFITLPVAQSGAISLNDRYYDAENIADIVKAVMTSDVEGIKGHLPDWERGFTYETPIMYWIGAMLDESTGFVWAKAYVPVSATEVREHFRVKAATGSRVGTSIYGTAEIWWDETLEKFRVSNLKLESIDLSHPARVGVPMTAAIPTLSAEMTESGGEAVDETVSIEEAIMPEDQIPQLEENENLLPVDVRELQTTVRDLNATLSEHRARLADLADIRELLGVSETDDAVLSVRQLRNRVAELSTENGRLLEATIESAVKTAVSVEAVRPTVLQAVQALNPSTREQVTRALESVLDLEHIKTLLKLGVQEGFGPTHERPEEDPSKAATGLIIYPEGTQPA